MQDFAFIDETLDINLTHMYILSIQASLNGLSFCILDPVQEKYIVFSHKNVNSELSFNDFLDNIEEYIQNTDLLNHKYKKVKFIWLSSKNTLIPKKHFKKENVKKYFEFNQKLDELDEIHFNKLKYIDAYSIYIVPNQIANIFSKQFPGINFYNQQIPFIEHSLAKYYSETKKVFVNINDNFIDINLTETGKLLLYNSFVYKTEMDLIYFIMYVCNQYNLNTETTEVVLSGLIDKKSSAFSKLKDFFQHLKFDKLPEEFSYSYTFNKIPNHSFTNLFNLQLCE